MTNKTIIAANVRQLSLFSDSEVRGNTIMSHDLLPRFLHSRHNKVLTHEDYVEEGERWMQLSNGEFFTIEPGNIRRPDGDIVYIYPGTRESLVEECIMSFASKGEFDPEKGEPGYIYNGVGGLQVVFTLYQLRMELKNRHKEYNLRELSEALEVLFKSNYGRGIKRTLTNKEDKLVPDSKGKRRYMQSFDRIEYEAPKKSAIRSETVIRIVLCDEATKQILAGQYLSYNCECSMEMKSPVARYLYKYLVQRWRNANLRGQRGETLEISQNDLLQDSGYPTPDNVSKRKAIFLKTINELIDADIIQPLAPINSIIEVKASRRIIDIIYHLTPSKAFVKHQIEASIRLNNSTKEISQVYGKIN